MSIETKYKGYKIEYNETMDKWDIDIAGTTKSRSALSDAKKYIDALEKKTKKFVPVSGFLDLRRALFTSNMDVGAGRFVPVKITSVASKQYGDLVVWIKTEDKRRKRVRTSDVVLATPENAKLMAKVDIIEAEIKSLRNKVAGLLESMERYRLSEEDVNTRERPQHSKRKNSKTPFGV